MVTKKKIMAKIQRITPNLWFNSEAEEAARFYTSIFKRSGIDKITYYTRAGQETHKMSPGSVMTVEFHLGNMKFVALNGGPVFQFNEAVSFIVSCKNQREVDHYWDRLSEGGDPNAQVCGWLKDKFGLSWQIVPTALTEMLSDPDTDKAEHAMEAMLKMKKIDIDELEAATQSV
jgi:predicted 3-demethylubiquinone-9 3-methyltransferase (glyoxalase superfamily)